MITVKEAHSLVNRFLVIPQRSESSGSINMLPLPSEGRESKVSYSAPWGGKGGNASLVQGLPWGIDTFHYLIDVVALDSSVSHCYDCAI